MVLQHLRVANLGVLEDAAIDPSTGFTVVTGETGAGKTLLLGGLRLVLGGKADSGAVGPFADQAQVDSLFDLGHEQLGASRVVPRDGRSRAISRERSYRQRRSETDSVTSSTSSDSMTSSL